MQQPNDQKVEQLPIHLESGVDAASWTKEAELNAVAPAIIQGDSGVLTFLVLLIVALIITVGAVGVISRLRFIQADIQQAQTAQSIDNHPQP